LLSQNEISYDVVKLFSEQLYASPLKAIEELVVNGWDANASLCSVLVDLEGPRPLIAVFDTGVGMTLAELESLWHIGVSHKPRVTTKRKQIGKFGIGKLASYAVARRATYVSKTSEGIHAVAIDFERFAAATDGSTGRTTPVTLTFGRSPT
jgi:HSP90 family molecular chaperone